MSNNDDSLHSVPASKNVSRTSSVSSKVRSAIVDLSLTQIKKKSAMQHVITISLDSKLSSGFLSPPLSMKEGNMYMLLSCGLVPTMFTCK